MALQFNPGAYESAFRYGRENEEANRRKPFETLELLTQMLNQQSQNRIQHTQGQELLGLKRQEADRAQQEFNIKYARPSTGNMEPQNEVPAGPSRLFAPRNLPPSMFSKLDAQPQGRYAPSDIIGNPEYGTHYQDQAMKAYKLTNSEEKPIAYQKTEYLDDKNRARIGAWDNVNKRLIKSPDDAYAPQSARGETAGNLRKEFIDRPEVKDFQTINTQVKSMDSLLQKSLAGDMGSKNFLDQALISIFNKINDPTSVIRESEYARTPEGLALVNRMQGALQKINQGGAGLTDSDRHDLVIASKIIANERGGTYAQTRSGYVNLAEDMRLEPSLITATMPDFSPYSVNTPTQQPRAGASPVPQFEASEEQLYQQWKAQQIGRRQ